MTNAEAIKMLKSKMDGHTDTSYEWAETVRMAIKALEQQTCEDAVSRNLITQTLNKMDRYVAEELMLCDTDKKFPKNEVFIVDDVYEQIVEQLPSVQPERRVGHWIQTQEKDDAEPCILWECSCCHKEFRSVVHKVSNYCPQCGCRIVEPQESEE